MYAVLFLISTALGFYLDYKQGREPTPETNAKNVLLGAFSTWLFMVLFAGRITWG